MPDKKRYKGYTQAQARASAKYRSKRARLDIMLQEDERDAIQAAAQAAGQSVNAYTRQAIQERMERDQAIQGKDRARE